MQAMVDVMGADDFKKLFSGVTFSIETGNGMWTTGNNDVVIGDKSQNDSSYVKKYTVHELAHIWDNSCDDCLSKGMAGATGSVLLNFDKGLFFATELTNYVPSGQVPTTNSKNNRREDWADSVMTVILPSSAEFNNWDQKRIDFVNKSIQGIN